MAPEHTYSCADSGLDLPIGTTCLTPFILRGDGWYYTPVKDPNGFEDRQNRFGLPGCGPQFFLRRLWSLDETYRYIWLEKE